MVALVRKSGRKFTHSKTWVFGDGGGSGGGGIVNGVVVVVVVVIVLVLVVTPIIVDSARRVRVVACKKGDSTKV